MSDPDWSVFHLASRRSIPDDIPTLGPGILAPVPAREALPWRRGLAWMPGLGLAFFAGSTAAGWWTARHAAPVGPVFAWERSIPFLAWTILPYVAIALLCPLSFLLCRSRQEVDRHALRLLSAQLIAVAGFFLLPLRLAGERPAVAGVLGWVFDALDASGFADSVSPLFPISLLVVLWPRYAGVTRSGWRWAVHLSAALAGVAALTSCRHHFIDLPAGVLAGAFCLWLWPDKERPPLARLRLSASPLRRRLAAHYLLAALACLLAAWLGGVALWLLWPAAALAVMAFNYAVAGADGFQKNDGRLSVGASLLLAPCLAGAWLGSRWRSRHRAPQEIMDGVWLGRLPGTPEMARQRFAVLLDLSAEMSAPAGKWRYVNLAWLDRLPPSRNQLATAAYQIARLRRKGPLLVACAHGDSQCAGAVAAWLLATGRAATVDQAVARVSARLPGLKMGAEYRAALGTLFLPGAAEA